MPLPPGGTGPSPPTRGSREGNARTISRLGSIPAHAGEPRSRGATPTGGRVHPRPRGGAARVLCAAMGRVGPSPPTRGSHRARDRARGHRRSIPAHAGEPAKHSTNAAVDRVHPRPRGGARSSSSTRGGSTGPSPPTRGSRAGRVHGEGLSGSIPAHAGEPPPPPAASDARWVHPRPRGGARTGSPAASGARGPSPPTRGSPVGVERPPSRFGSIPAHAGEPWGAARPTGRGRVHPRPRGGARWARSPKSSGPGPSPPTRGSLPRGVVLPHLVGSIPAHAGEPRPRRLRRVRARVHPRPRGGAVSDACPHTIGEGPSPPTRGSPLPRRAAARKVGSIPAHAGEPSRCATGTPRGRVHPRPRGGAAKGDAKVEALNGPSPPTRGSRHHPPAVCRPGGSIPAHAGEPTPSVRCMPSRGVHPRPRGGAGETRPTPRRPAGPSPPTRGSRRATACGLPCGGSIPAHAGEPPTATP